MTISELLAAVRRLLARSPFGPVARGAWCREQKRHLGVPGNSVVWIRVGNAALWAEWGARHGYFEVQQMDGLFYLRALDAPNVSR